VQRCAEPAPVAAFIDYRIDFARGVRRALFESLSLRHDIVLRHPVTSKQFPQTPANAGRVRTRRRDRIRRRQVPLAEGIFVLTAPDSLENPVTVIQAGTDDLVSQTVPEDVLRAKTFAMVRTSTVSRQPETANGTLTNIQNSISEGVLFSTCTA
jgi:PleD family two-component response regulator